MVSITFPSTDESKESISETSDAYVTGKVPRY